MGSSANVSFRNLSKVDLIGVAEICERIHRVEPTDSFVEHLHGIFTKAFSNIHFCAELHQLDPFVTLERINYTGDMDWMPFFYEHIHEHPQFRLLTDLKTEVGATHTETSHRDFLRSPLYNEFFVKVQSHNQMWIALFDENQFLNCIYSRERPYSDKELNMMQMLQPHMELAWHHWKQARSLKEELEHLRLCNIVTGEQEAANQILRQMIGALPSRQREVVEQVAAGLDNQQISDEMGISVRTVQKHLELIFQTMEVHHRTELAAKWHSAHSIQVY